MEVEHPEADTTNTNEADDIVMAEANVEPVPSPIQEVNAENAPEASVAQPEATVAATAPVPPPRPYTIEQAYNHGELITVRWHILVPPPTVSGPQFYCHIEHRPQVQKPKPRLPRFPGTVTSVGSFNANGFKSHNTFFDSSKNPYTKPRISSDRFWSHQQQSYYSCVLYDQGRIFPHMRLGTEAIVGLPCLEEALGCFRDAGLLSFVTDKEYWNEELLLQFYATLHIRGDNRDTKTWVLEWMTGNVHHEAKVKVLVID